MVCSLQWQATREEMRKLAGVYQKIPLGILIRHWINFPSINLIVANKTERKMISN